ncbi:hypothetical protein RIR_jg7161.t1 [Rhizophagus irregularis DAOM 181602=DAOM 197198]|uniref:Uncharacterized protein n=1 Tax=Rhizophagus irregularis (strain DAOM 197198w) TaxID=1432141 RepID=A0A015K3L3_RHIIW|nr:hypothetical protein RirG_053680 [Rhizophagus irregularis DAOM 197198w]GET64535.1 hypothetical protein RIR_jg7161.t1 [Rhizophagus irregularis DAOM 181602=DAOM 197198]
MSRIESHLGLDPLPSPNEPEPDLMQEDAPVTHVPLNIQSSAKSSLPPNSILTRPSPTITIVPNTSLPPSHLFPNAPPFTLSPPRKKKLTISKIVDSIGGAPLEQADSASSV